MQLGLVSILRGIADPPSLSVRGRMRIILVLVSDPFGFPDRILNPVLGLVARRGRRLGRNMIPTGCGLVTGSSIRFWR